ncbi:hypothetical protein [Myxococcus dinghuensis]|uniref:hypothetical protein n=1 Tax=Myxococcus dinghuensis TaxID=2906761 RepID=UPI002B2037F3|nr:hypothetical protein [Myxococcus dinghuensis]
MARIIAGVLLVLVGLPALALLAALIALHHLDAPWMKARILPLVEEASGLRVDYQQARVSLTSGARLEGVVVRNPAPLDVVAPELLRVAVLEAKWSLGDLLGGPVRVSHVEAHDVAIALVEDDAGHTSLDALSGPPSASPPPPVTEEPLGTSQQPAALLGAGLPVGHITLSGVSLESVRVRRGAVVERWKLRGLAAAIDVEPRDAAWVVLARLGQPGAPLPLEVSREGDAIAPAQAQLELALSAELGASAARVRVDLDVARQTFDTRFAVRPLLHGTVLATFDGARRHVAVDVERLQLADSAELQAQLLLPDASDAAPVLTRALADIDLERTLRVLPADWRPFTLGRGKLHLEARDIALSAMPRLGAQGHLGLDVEAAAFQFARDDLRVSLGDGRVSLVATPDARTGLDARLTFTLGGLDVAGPTAVRMPKASGKLEGHQLRPDPGSPLQVAGDASLSAQVESLDVRAAGLRATAERMGLKLDAPLAGEPPFTWKADLPVGVLRVVTAEGRQVLDGPVRVQLDASEVRPRMEDPRTSQGRARLVLDAGAMHATLNATKEADALAYTLDLQTPDLTAARPFLPDDVAARLPWQHLGVSVASTGKLTALFSAAPRVDHRTEVRLQRPGWEDVGARSAALVLRSRGDAWRHQGDLDFRIEALRVGETDTGAHQQTVTFDVDRRKPSVRLGIASQEGLKVSVDASLSFDRKARALRTELVADLPELGPLSPLLAKARVPRELEPAKLALKFDVKGTLRGVLTDFTSDGMPKVAPDPARTANFDGTALVDARGIRWRQDGLFINLPGMRWSVESRVDGPKRAVHSNLTVEKLTVAMNDRRLSLAALASDTDIDFTDKLEEDEVAVRQHLKLGSFEQKPALPYPIQGVEGTFTARRTPEGIIHVPDLQVTHVGTGTGLKVKGQLDLSNHGRRLAMRGELTQELAKLAQPGVFEGDGSVAIDFRLSSPDLVIFRTLSNVLFQNVNLKLPQSGVTLETLDGNVPLNENVAITDDGVKLLSDSDLNPYSMLRFADQHPLMSRSGYMSVARITTPLLTISPLAGNLSISQNVFSMSQLEMGVRGGRITGQCMLDWQGRNSTLEAHVRATGVQSSRGEPFDGNIAVVVSAKDRSVNGRAEILRIGNRHLLDLLDLEDPLHADPATNRVRYALRLGYPEHVRVSFNHGFGSLRITMGGLAKLISIDEIRGIPMGPIVDRAINTMTPPGAMP